MPLLRLRSDEQLVALFRAGNDEAFRVIHDRYRQRLLAYTRQMLPRSRQDAEDTLQDIFVRAYSGLLANDRELALRAWLYRIAHNRCIDELRRPLPPTPEALALVRSRLGDPTAEAEQRESLRRLIADVQRLPEQQRSALLMRELEGMAYAHIAAALAVSIPAVKSLLVRARVGLAQALEARDTACSEIREELIVAHDRGVRASGMARRHMRDCVGCREFRGELRGMSHQFAALVPTLGPLGVIANALGIGGGATGGAGAAAGGGVAAAGAAGTSGAVASAGAFSTGHIATLLAAAVVTAGGAVEIQRTISARVHHRTHHHIRAALSNEAPPLSFRAPSAPPAATAQPASPAPSAPPAAPSTAPSMAATNNASAPATVTATPHPANSTEAMMYGTLPPGAPQPGTSTSGASGPTGSNGGVGSGSVPGTGTPSMGTTPPGGSTGGVGGSTGGSTGSQTGGSPSTGQPGGGGSSTGSGSTGSTPPGSTSTTTSSGTSVGSAPE